MPNNLSTLQHLMFAAKNGTRQFETVLQSMYQITENDIEKVVANDQTSDDFKTSRSGSKHVIGMYDEIDGFVSYVEDAAEGGSSKEMASDEASKHQKQHINGEMFKAMKEHSKKTDYSDNVLNQDTERSDSNIGAIGRLIGIEIPKLSIVFCVIVLCFITGFLLSFGKSVDDIKTIWTIFFPIITGALGFIFGSKSENNSPSGS